MSRKASMDLRKLKTLIDLVAESGIAELEITEGDGKVKIVKFSPVTAPVAYAPPASASAPAPAAAAPETPAAPEGHVAKAPMVGTFYRAPNPGARSDEHKTEPVTNAHSVSRLRLEKKKT